MKVSRVLAAAAVLVLGAQVARAQIAGLPFYPTPTGMGVLAAAEYANPGSIQVGGVGFSRSVLALRAGAGFGPFGATVVGGQYKISTFTSQTAYGASVAMKVFGGGLVPVSISVQAGYGTNKSQLTNTTTATTTYLPVGAAVRVNVPLFPLKPFAVGYYTLGSSDVQKEFRATIGADFNLLLGLGAHVAYDIGTGTNSAKSWGVGAHFNFRLPIPL